MKSILAILALVGFTTTAQAGTSAINAYFGTSGHNLESSPLESSAQDAANLFEVLGVRAKGGKKVIEAGDGELSCDAPVSGIHSLQARCELMALTDSASIISGRKKIGVVKIRGELAQKLFDALESVDSNDDRAGHNTRSAANLSCTLKMIAGMPVECELKDVIAIKIDL